MLRIAFICSDRGPCPPVRGGAIQLLISRVAPLLAKQHKVTVYSIVDPALPKKESREGVRYLRFPQDQFLEQVCHHLAERKVDIIQTFNRPGWISRLRKLAPNARFVLSLHNMIHEQGEEKLHLRDADQIITVSRFLAEATARQYPEIQDRIRPLYTGVDLKEYAPVWSRKGQEWRKQIREKYGLGNQQRVILFVGRLVPYKGCHLLVKAMKKIVKKIPDAVLLVVGSKWYGETERDEYFALLKKTATKQGTPVIFTSYVPVDEIPRFFAAADLFVCASQWQEPLARVHYEAMAAGLPIVTTDRGGNHEVIRDGYNGLVIKDYQNEREFAKKAVYLLRHRETAEAMGRRNVQLAQTVYHFQRVAGELERIYHTLAGKTNSSANT